MNALSKKPLMDMVNLFIQRILPILKMQSSQIDSLRNEVSQLRSQVVSLEHRTTDLVEALQLRTASPVAGPAVAGGEGGPQAVLTERDFIHHELAARYRFIIEQRLARLASDLLNSQGLTGKERPVAEAQLVAGMGMALFGGSAVDRAWISWLLAKVAAPEDIARICDDAAGLRSRITCAGDQGWDTRFKKGKVLEPARQEVWGSCPPAAPVRFVVAPAYLAHGQLLSKQLVFTNEQRTSKNFVTEIVKQLRTPSSNPPT